MIPENVIVWESILDDLLQFTRQNAIQDELTHSLHHYTSPFPIEVLSEVELQTYVRMVTSFVAKSCGGYNSTTTSQGLRGSLDISILNTTTRENKIVGEVETFWEFPVNDDNLVTLWKEGTRRTRRGLMHTTLHEHLSQYSRDHSCSLCNDPTLSLQRKTFEAVRQMHGYLQNRLSYGFLTTWNQWWFMRSNGSTLLVSRAFPHNAQNPTVCQVLGRMLLQADENFQLNMVPKPNLTQKIDQLLNLFFNQTHTMSREESKSSTDNVIHELDGQSTKQTLYRCFSNFINEMSSDPELLQYFLLSLDLVYIGYGRAGSVFKATVDLGKDKHIEVVLKIADVLKSPNLQEELEFEAHVYKKLNSLQGKCIPFLFVDSPLWYYRGITKCLIMSYEGTNMKLVDITSIPFSVREQAWKDYHKMKDMGVRLLDMKKSNVCWNSFRQQIVFIDFGSVYLKDENRRPPCETYSDDEECLESILQLTSEDEEVDTVPD